MISRTLYLTITSLVLLLAGCGMKGPLRHPAPPPADPALVAPPTVTPAPAATPTPASQP